MICHGRIAGFALIFTLAGCAHGGRASVEAPVARATIVNSAGATVGNATIAREGNALRVRLELHDLSDGTHGVHLHAVGKCEGPGFASAGPHLDTGSHRHGVQNPAGPHDGDLPNVVVSGGRSVAYTAMTLRVQLESGGSAFFDADGTAIVIHANADDERTDPSGNSGARIACGVLTR